MKTKIVLWGTDEQDQKLLIAIELLASENKVRITTFPEEVATEAFYNQMMNLWRNNYNVIMPEKHTVIERDLSATESLLPDHIKADRTDLVNRAKTEWHFVVLSAKLYESFNEQISDFNEKIDQLTNFDSSIWEEMKAFWSKVQHQVKEQNLFREHANQLRNQTNTLFDRMKELKKVLDQEFVETSKQQLENFMNNLQDIEDRIEKGLGLQPIFNELKKLQDRFKGTQFTREDRTKVWKRLDKAFKTVKEKRYGSKGKERSALERLQRRYDGLVAAIEKMQKSIDRDQSDIDFQTKKIESTDGQLELQIRQAKLKMNEERIKSKKDKLQDMMKTKAELEEKMERERKRSSESNKKKEAEQKEPVAGAPKDASESTQTEDESSKEQDPGNKETLMGAITTTVGEALGDVVDTVKAAAEVVSDKIEEALESQDEEE